VEAVRSRYFSVYAVRTVDEAIGLLTGVSAGVADATGAYPPDTVNGRVAHRLHALSQLKTTIAVAAARRAGAQRPRPA
jgi:hypothetical protein